MPTCSVLVRVHVHDPTLLVHVHVHVLVRRSFVRVLVHDDTSTSQDVETGSSSISRWQSDRPDRGPSRFAGFADEDVLPAHEHEHVHEDDPRMIEDEDEDEDEGEGEGEGGDSERATKSRPRRPRSGPVSGA